MLADLTLAVAWGSHHLRQQLMCRCSHVSGRWESLLFLSALQVAQYPLGMGKKEKGGAGGGSGAGNTGTLAVTVNADGDVNYDAIVRQGRNRDKIVYSDHKALVPKLDSLTEVGFFSLLGTEVAAQCRESRW